MAQGGTIELERRTTRRMPTPGLVPMGGHTPTRCTSGAGSTTDDHRRRALDAIERGAALREAGRLTDARAAFAEAIAAADHLEEVEVIGTAALGLGGVWLNEHRSTLDRLHVRELQRRCLTALDPRSSLAVRLAHRLAAEEAYLCGDAASAPTIVGQARRWGDPRVLGDALSLAHHCMLGPDHGEDRLVLAEELMATAEATRSPLDASIGLLWRTVDLFLLGDPRAERSFRELVERNEHHDVACVRYATEAIEVMRSIRSGHLDRAEEQARVCFEHGVEVGDADALGWYGAQLVNIRWLQGLAAELLQLLCDLATSPTVAERNDAFVAGVAALAASAGDAAQARGALDQLLANGLDRLRHSSVWLTLLLGVIDAAAFLGDAPAARAAYDLLQPFEDLPIMGSLAIACFGSAHRPLGVAAATFGRIDVAIDHFEAAVRADLRSGNRPCHALACCELADALDRRGEPGDATRAATIRRQAATVATELGLTAIVTRLAPPTVMTVLRCQKVGRSWELTAGDNVTLVPAGLGMEYLARLIANPGLEVSALDLVSGNQVAASAGHVVLDERARAAYRQALADLRDDVEDAERCCDPERAERARDEIDRVVDELGRITGLGGRSRPFRDESERARTSVQKAIRRAVAGIAEAAPELGDLLARRIITGAACCYDPSR